MVYTPHLLPDDYDVRRCNGPAGFMFCVATGGCSSLRLTYVARRLRNTGPAAVITVTLSP